VNREQPHVVVLPEDDKDRQLANGFWLQLDWNRQRWLRVLPVAGGWTHVVHLLPTLQMDHWPQRFAVLLIDFDNQFAAHLQNVKNQIPAHLTDRVFILGALEDPEALKRAGLVGSYEDIGGAMAEDCRQETDATWGHAHLQHNAGELDRLRQHVRPLLF
jgi:hypothetical protein